MIDGPTGSARVNYNSLEARLEEYAIFFWGHEDLTF